MPTDAIGSPLGAGTRFPAPDAARVASGAPRAFSALPSALLTGSRATVTLVGSRVPPAAAPGVMPSGPLPHYGAPEYGSDSGTPAPVPVVQTPQNFAMWAGDDATIGLVLYDRDGVTPLPSEGLVLVWGLGPVNGGPATLLKSSADPTQLTILGPGEALVTLRPPDTTARLGPYRQQLTAIDSHGAVETLLVGAVTINPSSLRPVCVNPLRVIRV